MEQQELFLILQTEEALTVIQAKKCNIKDLTLSFRSTLGDKVMLRGRQHNQEKQETMNVVPDNNPVFPRIKHCALA